MLPDKLNKKDKFDDMLGRTLRRSRHPAPDDFTPKMLERVRLAEQKKILERVVLQERLALAACLALGAAAIIAITVFPENITAAFHSIVGNFTAQSSSLVSKIPLSINTVINQWQFLIVLAALAGFAVYSLVDLLAGDILKTP